ncbi:hypothetical protein LHJ74_07615 [Streptomyces sp. N2-109]|uniref:CHRD domain-containing protein n=1 Tax=Streptomyces gossypii TaxID=2883101 RepID=A0ABT2JPM9_9ACTN|nr:hypothetical protein [Streptomyces gossypii]MCT2589786.1 hypothetical protein [Streptomyces gossypii]
MKKTLTTACAAAVAVAPLMAFAPAAAAGGMPTPDHHRALTLHAKLDPFKVNKVRGHGFAKVHLKGRHVTVKMKVKGLLAKAPHAQHIHIAAKGVCPPDSAATKHNGKLSLSTPDGAPFYGRIGASLTTKGDTSPNSALAVDRFPTGPMYHYKRSFTVSAETAKSLRAGTAVVVVHGIDYNGNGKYDFNLGKSLLDPKLPAEATFPALCGALKKSPHGGISGGQGGTQDSDAGLTTAAGAGLLAAAGGAFYLRRRTSRSN